jgi:hypothetical protein
MKKWLLLLLMTLVLGACAPEPDAPEILVTLLADGVERTFSYTLPVTVEEFLSDAEVELGELDQVNPLPYTQISDGMRITIVRVQEELDCEETPLPFARRTVPNEGLQPGEERLGQAGQNGVEEICYRVFIRDGARQEPVEISRTVIASPQDEVVYVGPSGELVPVPINGTLAYLSNRNIWVMRGSSSTKRLLTTTGDADGRVFALSADGRRLLFTRETFGGTRETTFNRLWLIDDTSREAPEPLQLIPTNILYADWVPGAADMISYSTGEPRDAAPGWQAFNDLWIMRIDPQTGEAINAEEVIEQSSGGLYGWWGTGYQWSRDGEALAWIRADSIGLVDLENGELLPLLDYPVYNTRQPWSWRATVSWSPENDLLLTTVHGQPIGSEPPETSPAFHVAVTDAAGTFSTELFENAGIWAVPKFSPLLTEPGSEFPQGYLAFLQCRDFPNCFSDNSEYDLIITDRDGSNPRQVFPEVGQPGITQRDFNWSPDGRQIAFIYQGNLWLVDVNSLIANQLTLDGGASQPVWTP